IKDTMAPIYSSLKYRFGSNEHCVRWGQPQLHWLVLCSGGTAGAASSLIRGRKPKPVFVGAMSSNPCYVSLRQTEMMSDSIDDALDNDEAEEETEELTNQ
ncbi:hypothetical protein KI387_024186, partial [Taxus chinensis]